MTASTRIPRAIESATRGLVDREAVVELIALGAVAREHVLWIGPPGAAKSEAVRRIATALGASTFEYLPGRFTRRSARMDRSWRPHDVGGSTVTGVALWESLDDAGRAFRLHAHGIEPVQIRM
jgi:hypothetical protein